MVVQKYPTFLCKAQKRSYLLVYSISLRIKVSPRRQKSDFFLWWKTVIEVNNTKFFWASRMFVYDSGHKAGKKMKKKNNNFHYILKKPLIKSSQGDSQHISWKFPPANTNQMKKEKSLTFNREPYPLSWSSKCGVKGNAFCLIVTIWIYFRSKYCFKPQAIKNWHLLYVQHGSLYILINSGFVLSHRNEKKRRRIW